MRYEQFLNVVLGRARMLGFIDSETQQVDAAEVELAAYQALLDIADGWDLDTFTVINDHMGLTSAGERNYPLPSDFGRLLAPKDENESGIYILVTANNTPTPLCYRDPEDWFRHRVTTNSTPAFFTITHNDTLQLDPPPDTNGGSNYTLQGVYVRRVDALDDDETLLVSHPTALIAGTLARLALDKNAPQAVALITERDTALSKLVNNQARTRQHFRRRHGEHRARR